jgi:hypothetical protein
MIVIASYDLLHKGNCVVCKTWNTHQQINKELVCLFCLELALNLPRVPLMKNRSGELEVLDTSNIAIYFKSKQQPIVYGEISSNGVDGVIKLKCIKLKSSNLKVIKFNIKEKTVEVWLENKSYNEIPISDWDKETKVVEEIN